MADAIYGIPVYADAVYGVVENDTTLRYALQIDWNGDGVYEDNETIYLKYYRVERGRDKYIDPNGTLKFITTGRASFRLKNNDRRFDEWYTSGPLYGLLDEGKFIRFGVLLAGETDIRWRFTGIINEIYPAGDSNLETEISALDGLTWLYDKNVNITVQSGLRVDQAISLVLAECAWPALWEQDIEVTSDIIPYYWAEQSGAAAIEALTKSALGYFCTRGDGTAKFISRNTVGTPVATLTDENTSKQIGLMRNKDNYFNIIKVKYFPRKQEATGVLWQALEKPSIANGDTWETFGDYMVNDVAVPALSIVAPVPTTDYTANTAQDGGGTDKTSQVVVTATHFGKTVKITVKNNSGGTVYLTLMQIRGVAITAPYPGSYVVNRSDYLTAPRTFTLELDWQQSAGAAISLATAFADFLSTRRAWPTVQIEARPEVQFAADLFDTVVHDSGHFVSNNSYRIGKIIEESTSETLQGVRSTWKLEPYIIGVSYWTWDIAEFGVDTIFGI